MALTKTPHCADAAEEAEEQQGREEQLTCGPGHGRQRGRQQQNVILRAKQLERRAPGGDFEPARFPELPAHVEARTEQNERTEVIEQTPECGVCGNEFQEVSHGRTPWERSVGMPRRAKTPSSKPRRNAAVRSNRGSRASPASSAASSGLPTARADSSPNSPGTSARFARHFSLDAPTGTPDRCRERSPRPRYFRAG
jgi:hypothetical protein